MRIDAGVIGGSGLVAGELLRLLETHPAVHVSYVASRSQSGRRLGELHDGLTDLHSATCVAEPGADVDVLFLALPHGESETVLSALQLSDRTTVIDLSSDHRPGSGQEDYVYGLTETARSALGSARSEQRHVANPGCFATAIQIGLLPLMREGLLVGDIHSSAVTGSTGAGNGFLPTTHFSWRSANMQVYKPFRHQHLDEIRASVQRHQPGYGGKHYFIPYRGPFTRGIIATSYTAFEGTAEEAASLYRASYADEAFVRCCDQQPALKQVVNTNMCFVTTEVADGMCIVTTVIDNLLKGAAGQAVQNMNVLFGLDEETGLRLKASAF